LGGGKSRFGEADARSYIETVLRDRRHLFTGEYRLQRFPSPSYAGVYRLDYDDAPAWVIRFHLLRHNGRAEHFFRIQDFLSAQHLPIPELIHADRSPAVRRRWGVEVSIETFIEGANFKAAVQKDPATVRPLARMMARFHAITSPGHGLPWQPIHTSSHFNGLMEEIGRLYAEGMRRTRLISQAEARAHLAWFEHWRARLGAIQEYNLVHGDINWENEIFTPDGKTHVIDFVATHFGFFELDLAVCACSLGESDPIRERLFAEYFQIRGEEAARRYAAHEPFFTAYHCLRKFCSKSGKARRVERGVKREKEPYAEQAAYFLEKLRQTLAASP